MNKLIILLILLATVLFTAGCTDPDIKDNISPQESKEKSTRSPQDINKDSENSQGIKGNSTDSQEMKKEGTVVEATQLEQINTSLQEGPVLVKIGAEWCSPCQALKPILKDLAAENSGKITIMSIDMDQSPDLATYFEIGYIPDVSLIMGIDNGEYVYMQQDGSTSKDRLQARLLGQMEKEEYQKLIDVALIQEGKGKS